jgi:hypothetical protein
VITKNLGSPNLLLMECLLALLGTLKKLEKMSFDKSQNYKKKWMSSQIKNDQLLPPLFLNLNKFFFHRFPSSTPTIFIKNN